MSSKQGTRRFKDAEEKRAKKARETARLWSLVKAAVKVIDSSRVVSRGVYEMDPAAVIALRHHCDEMRFALKMHELELLNGGEDE